jgi:hypothetical protein
MTARAPSLANGSHIAQPARTTTTNGREALFITLTIDTSEERNLSSAELQTLETTLHALGYRPEFVHVDEASHNQYVADLFRVRDQH